MHMLFALWNINAILISGLTRFQVNFPEMSSVEERGQFRENFQSRHPEKEILPPNFKHPNRSDALSFPGNQRSQIVTSTPKCSPQIPESRICPPSAFKNLNTSDNVACKIVPKRDEKIPLPNLSNLLPSQNMGQPNSVNAFTESFNIRNPQNLVQTNDLRSLSVPWKGLESENKVAYVPEKLDQTEPAFDLQSKLDQPIPKSRKISKKKVILDPLIWTLPNLF